MKSFLNFLLNEEDCQDIAFQGEKVEKRDLHFLNVYQCKFTNCVFSACIFESFNFSACTFVNCKFLDSSFFSCTMKKNYFLDCDFVNVKFTELNWKQNKFERAMFKYVEMRKNKLELETYDTCNLVSIESFEDQFFDVSFSLSHILMSSFQSTFCDTNFNTSSIEDTFFDLKKFKNCFLTPSQGLELLKYYGITFH